MIGAVDIGGTKIAVGAVRDDGLVLHRSQCPTDPERGFSDAMHRIRAMLRDAVSACGPLDGIGVASPGPLNPVTGEIGDVGTLPGWERCNLVADLEAEFGVSVAVENDADAAALAEWSAMRHVRRFIFITVSTGIGGGIVLDGQLYRGVGGAHPELGHQIIDPSGPPCYCKAHGCWESLASGSAMAAWMREASPAAAPLSAAAICALAARGDTLALQAVKREAYYLGLGLANLVTLFAPETIVLGGGVMKSSRLFLREATQVVLELCTQVPAEQTSIALASLGPDAGLKGAALAWLYRYGN